MLLRYRRFQPDVAENACDSFSLTRHRLCIEGGNAVCWQEGKQGIDVNLLLLGLTKECDQCFHTVRQTPHIVDDNDLDLRCTHHLPQFGKFWSMLVLTPSSNLKQ